MSSNYSRSEWASLSIQDRIRAMNDTLDTVEENGNNNVVDVDKKITASVAADDGLPARNSNVKSQEEARSMADKSSPPTESGDGGVDAGAGASNSPNSQNILKRASVVDMWRKRDSLSSVAGATGNDNRIEASKPRPLVLPPPSPQKKAAVTAAAADHHRRKTDGASASTCKATNAGATTSSSAVIHRAAPSFPVSITAPPSWNKKKAGQNITTGVLCSSSVSGGGSAESELTIVQADPIRDSPSPASSSSSSSVKASSVYRSSRRIQDVWTKPEKSDEFKEENMEEPIHDESITVASAPPSETTPRMSVLDRWKQRTAVATTEQEHQPTLQVLPEPTSTDMKGATGNSGSPQQPQGQSGYNYRSSTAASLSSPNTAGDSNRSVLEKWLDRGSSTSTPTKATTTASSSTTGSTFHAAINKKVSNKQKQQQQQNLLANISSHTNTTRSISSHASEADETSYSLCPRPPPPPSVAASTTADDEESNSVVAKWKLRCTSSNTKDKSKLDSTTINNNKDETSVVSRWKMNRGNNAGATPLLHVQTQDHGDDDDVVATWDAATPVEDKKSSATSKWGVRPSSSKATATTTPMMLHHSDSGKAEENSARTPVDEQGKSIVSANRRRWNNPAVVIAPGSREEEDRYPFVASPVARARGTTVRGKSERVDEEDNTEEDNTDFDTTGSVVSKLRARRKENLKKSTPITATPDMMEVGGATTTDSSSVVNRWRGKMSGTPNSTTTTTPPGYSVEEGSVGNDSRSVVSNWSGRLKRTSTSATSTSPPEKGEAENDSVSTWSNYRATKTPTSTTAETTEKLEVSGSVKCKWKRRLAEAPDSAASALFENAEDQVENDGCSVSSKWIGRLTRTPKSAGIATPQKLKEGRGGGELESGSVMSQWTSRRTRAPNSTTSAATAEETPEEDHAEESRSDSVASTWRGLLKKTPDAKMTPPIMDAPSTLNISSNTTPEKSGGGEASSGNNNAMDKWKFTRQSGSPVTFADASIHRRAVVTTPENPDHLYGDDRQTFSKNDRTLTPARAEVPEPEQIPGNSGVSSSWNEPRFRSRCSSQSYYGDAQSKQHDEAKKNTSSPDTHVSNVPATTDVADKWIGRTEARKDPPAIYRSKSLNKNNSWVKNDPPEISRSQSSSKNTEDDTALQTDRKETRSECLSTSSLTPMQIWGLRNTAASPSKSVSQEAKGRSRVTNDRNDLLDAALISQTRVTQDLPTDDPQKRKMRTCPSSWIIGKADSEKQQEQTVQEALPTTLHKQHAAPLSPVLCAKERWQRITSPVRSVQGDTESVCSNQPKRQALQQAEIPEESRTTRSRSVLDRWTLRNKDFSHAQATGAEPQQQRHSEQKGQPTSHKGAALLGKKALVSTSDTPPRSRDITPSRPARHNSNPSSPQPETPPTRSSCQWDAQKRSPLRSPDTTPSRLALRNKLRNRCLPRSTEDKELASTRNIEQVSERNDLDNGDQELPDTYEHARKEFWTTPPQRGRGSVRKQSPGDKEDEAAEQLGIQIISPLPDTPEIKRISNSADGGDNFVNHLEELRTPLFGQPEEEDGRTRDSDAESNCSEESEGPSVAQSLADFELKLYDGMGPVKGGNENVAAAVYVKTEKVAKIQEDLVAAESIVLSEEVVKAVANDDGTGRRSRLAARHNVTKRWSNRMKSCSPIPSLSWSNGRSRSVSDAESKTTSELIANSYDALRADSSSFVLEQSVQPEEVEVVAVLKDEDRVGISPPLESQKDDTLHIQQMDDSSHSISPLVEKTDDDIVRELERYGMDEGSTLQTNQVVGGLATAEPEDALPILPSRVSPMKTSECLSQGVKCEEQVDKEPESLKQDEPDLTIGVLVASGSPNSSSGENTDEGVGVVEKVSQDKPLQLLVLVSNQSLSRSQSSMQQNAFTILRAHKIPHEALDGAELHNRDRRNELFKISGLWAKYPQFFIVQGGETRYWGDWDALEESNENGTLREDLKVSECLNPPPLQLSSLLKQDVMTNAKVDDGKPELSAPAREKNYPMIRVDDGHSLSSNRGEDAGVGSSSFFIDPAVANLSPRKRSISRLAQALGQTSLGDRSKPVVTTEDPANPFPQTNQVFTEPRIEKKGPCTSDAQGATELVASPPRTDLPNHSRAEAESPSSELKQKASDSSPGEHVGSRSTTPVETPVLPVDINITPAHAIASEEPNPNENKTPVSRDGGGVTSRSKMIGQRLMARKRELQAHRLRRRGCDSNDGEPSQPLTPEAAGPGKTIADDTKSRDSDDFHHEFKEDFERPPPASQTPTFTPEPVFAPPPWPSDPCFSKRATSPIASPISDAGYSDGGFSYAEIRSTHSGGSKASTLTNRAERILKQRRQKSGNPRDPGTTDASGQSPETMQAQHIARSFLYGSSEKRKMDPPALEGAQLLLIASQGEHPTSMRDSLFNVSSQAPATEAETAAARQRAGLISRYEQSSRFIEADGAETPLTHPYQHVAQSHLDTGALSGTGEESLDPTFSGDTCESSEDFRSYQSGSTRSTRTSSYRDLARRRSDDNSRDTFLDSATASGFMSDSSHAGVGTLKNAYATMSLGQLASDLAGEVSTALNFQNLSTGVNDSFRMIISGGESDTDRSSPLPQEGIQKKRVGAGIPGVCSDLNPFEEEEEVTAIEVEYLEDSLDEDDDPAQDLGLCAAVDDAIVHSDSSSGVEQKPHHQRRRRTRATTDTNAGAASSLEQQQHQQQQRRQQHLAHGGLGCLTTSAAAVSSPPAGQPSFEEVPASRRKKNKRMDV